MLAKTALILTAAVAVSAASNGLLYPGQLAAKRDLAARQTASATDSSGGADSSGCVSAAAVLQSVYTSLPTPPPELVSYEASNPITDACSFTAPSSLQGEFSSYEAEVSSWLTAHSSEIFSALSQCPLYSSQYNSAASGSFCSTAAAAGGSGSGSGSGSGGASTTATGSSSGGSGAGTTATSKNASPQATTGFLGAVAAAGLLVVAAL